MPHSHHHSPEPDKRGRLARIRNKIFIGLTLATPIIATLWIFNFLLKLTTSWFPRNLLPSSLDRLLGGYLLQIIVLLLLIILFYVLGELAHNFFGKRLYNMADRIFSAIPIIKSIYAFVRQLCEWLAKSRSSMFDSVVLIEYPRRGCYVIGLVTAKTGAAIASNIKDENGVPQECINVFVATTPNPTSGFFVIVPKKDVTPLNIDIADAVNLIISAGAILPDRAAPTSPTTMLEMIDSLIMKPAGPDKESGISGAKP